MRRIAALAIAAVLGASAYLMGAPGAPAGPDFGTTIAPGSNGASGSPSVWYCSWVDSGALRDSVYGLAAAVPVTAALSLPSPIPNEDPDTLPLQMPGPGASAVDTASVVRRGEAPGLVEFTDGPATVSSLVWADEVVTGDRCVVSVPKVWHLAGGTTADGFFLNLRLFNPFPENAKITINAQSEFGAEPLPEFDGMDVPSRSWVTIDLTRVIPLLDELALTVETEQGLVIPSLVLADATDEASWPGTGLSTTWDFPVTTDGGLEASLVISNGGESDATVSIDVFTTDGPIVDAIPEGVVAPAGIPVRIPLADLAEPPFGIRVRSDAPVSAVVEARPPTPEEVLPDEEVPPPTDGEAEEPPAPEQPPAGLAGTVGLIDAATRWLIPAVGSVPDSVSTVWVMNPGPEPATVTVTPIGSDGAGTSDKILVPPGSVAAIEVATGSAPGVEGFDLESAVPVSVAVSVRGERGVAFVAGVAVGE